MLLPLRSKNPPESLPVGTVLLIAANILVYAFTSDGLSIHKSVVEQYAVSGAHFTLLRSFTSMFLHGNLFHLLGNMWFLYLFGFAVEGRLRTPKFLIVYLAAGFAGDLLHELMLGRLHPDLWSLGASGAIMGVVGAALYMFPFGKVDFLVGWGLGFWRVYTFDMYWVAIIYIGLDVLEALIFAGQDGVGHFAHIGGALAGLVACALMFPKRDSNDASEAKAMLHETKDYATLSSREMAAMSLSDPNNTTLVINWMDRCLRDGNIMPECQQSFDRLLPAILRNEPVQSVASILAHLARTPGAVSADNLLSVSARLEAKGEPTFAVAMLDHAMRVPNLPDSALESALFRSAVICEKSLRNVDQARIRYGEVVRLFPMSPLADQSRMRLSALGTAV